VKTAILINRGGGSAGDRKAIESALESAGIGGDLQWLDGYEIPAAAAAAVSDGAELVVAGGGDGTLSCVAGALAGTETKLGILPLGTLNHFARDLGIPAKLEDAARLIAEGRDRRVDVAELNGRIFINNSAIGIYPLMVSNREAQQEQLGRAKSLALLVAAVHTLLRFSTHRLTLTVNDLSGQVDTPLLFVGNNDYRLDMPGAGTREHVDRGELCVMVLRRKSRWGFFAAALRALFGRDRPDDVVRLDDVHRLRVDAARPFLIVSLDGETEHLATPLVYRIRPKALRVITPSGA
jgi:diacylglycerol kinase family enzyme